LFDIIYKLTDDFESVKLATYWTIQDFEKDGCCYLELRSTPRDDLSTGMTKEIYVQALLEGIKLANQELSKLTTRIILSMDRRKTLVENFKILKLAKKYMSEGVVGLDVCGDPTKGNPQEIVQLIHEAKLNGLPITLHLAEIKEQESENEILLQAHPDRIGHGTFLNHDSKPHKNIPLEICMTSNIFCKTVGSYASHHFQNFHVAGHPCIICVSLFFLCSDSEGALSYQFEMVDGRQGYFQLFSFRRV
jgi:adenosine deaminase